MFFRPSYLLASLALFGSSVVQSQEPIIGVEAEMDALIVYSNTAFRYSNVGILLSFEILNKISFTLQNDLFLFFISNKYMLIKDEVSSSPTKIGIYPSVFSRNVNINACANYLGPVGCWVHKIVIPAASSAQYVVGTNTVTVNNQANQLSAADTVTNAKIISSFRQSDDNRFVQGLGVTENVTDAGTPIDTVSIIADSNHTLVSTANNHNQTAEIRTYAEQVNGKISPLKSTAHTRAVPNQAYLQSAVADLSTYTHPSTNAQTLLLMGNGLSTESGGFRGFTYKSDITQGEPNELSELPFENSHPNVLMDGDCSFASCYTMGTQSPSSTGHILRYWRYDHDLSQMTSANPPFSDLDPSIENTAETGLVHVLRHDTQVLNLSVINTHKTNGEGIKSYAPYVSLGQENQDKSITWGPSAEIKVNNLLQSENNFALNEISSSTQVTSIATTNVKVVGDSPAFAMAGNTIQNQVEVQASLWTGHINSPANGITIKDISSNIPEAYQQYRIAALTSTTAVDGNSNPQPYVLMHTYNPSGNGDATLTLNLNTDEISVLSADSDSTFKPTASTMLDNSLR